MTAGFFFAPKTPSPSILPPPAPLLLALFFFILCMKAKRPGWRAFTGTLAALSLVSLLALSIPLVATALTAPLNRYPVITQDSLKQAQAIVILGGGTHYNAAEYGRDTVSGITLQRVRYGAYLAKKTN